MFLRRRGDHSDTKSAVVSAVHEDDDSADTDAADISGIHDLGRPTADRRGMFGKTRSRSVVDVVNAVNGFGRSFRHSNSRGPARANGLLQQVVATDDGQGQRSNCWSIPPCDTFHVRGKNYLVDRKKVPSGEFLLVPSAVDFFTTPHQDECPPDIGRYSCAKGGMLEDSKKPSLLINFRLGFGVLVLYFDVPDKFAPYLRHRCTDAPEVDGNDAAPTIYDFSNPADRALAQFFKMCDSDKNYQLKLLPQLVQSPLLVRSLWKPRPAIIGRKVPASYAYHSNYLSIDYDICKSEFAQKILTLVRGYASKLTLDIGFVIEGSQPDHLPEQVFGAIRIHQLDLTQAPELPPMIEAMTIQCD